MSDGPSNTNQPELILGKAQGAPNTAAAGTPANASTPLGINANSEKAPADAPTLPDGEKDSTGGNRADEKPGDPQADPQNLGKDAQAVGGVVGTTEQALGASSLGQTVGTAVREGDQAAIAKVVEDQPDPVGEVRTSWAESGDYTK